MTRRLVEPRRLVIGFQQAPPVSLTGEADTADTTEISIPTEWLIELGWSSECPELQMVLNSEGINITPLYPRADEEPRVFTGAAGDLPEATEG